MKTKLTLIAIALLAIAPFANAATVTITGPTSLNLNSIYDFTIMLSGAVDNVGGLDFNIGSSNPALAAMSDVTLVAGNRDTGVDFIYAGSAPYQFEPSQAAGTAASLLDGAIVTFKITTGSSMGSFNLLIANVFSNDKLGNEIVPTYTGLSGIQIVPEPITVALLGLGGLFVARKKK